MYDFIFEFLQIINNKNSYISNLKNKIFIREKMQVKTRKKQKLENNPYIQQENFPVKQQLPTNLSLKVSKLSNSLYSTKQSYQMSSWEIQNIQLKNKIKSMQENYIKKQEQFKKQIQQLKNTISQKNKEINSLQIKIFELENEKELKNISLKQKLGQCQDLIKQIQEKKLHHSNIQSILQSSRNKFSPRNQTQQLFKNFNAATTTRFTMERSQVLSPGSIVPNNNVTSEFTNRNMFSPNEVNRNIRPRSPPVIFHTTSIPKIINVSPAGHYQPVVIKNHPIKINQNSQMNRTNIPILKQSKILQTVRPVSNHNSLVNLHSFPNSYQNRVMNSLIR